MLNQFTNQYPLSKTLRFELKPVGETADYLEDFKSQHLKDFVRGDQKRAENYKAIKEIIDDFHRSYIEEKLGSPVNPETGELWLSSEDFENAYSYYQKLKSNHKDDKARDVWQKTQTELRKKLVKAFVNNTGLFKKELIIRNLPDWLKKHGTWEEHKAVVESFNKFTTYFSGFHENRKNMYSDKDQSTAIAFRLMNENLPRFFNNCEHYRKLAEAYPDLSLIADVPLLSEMGVTRLDDIFQPRYFIDLFTQKGMDLYQQLLGGKAKESGEKKQGLNEQINLFKQQVQARAKESAEQKNENPKKVHGLSGFTHLYKQILSDRETASFIPEEFENDRQLLETLGEFISVTTRPQGTIEHLEKAMARLADIDVQAVFVKRAGLTDISQNIFGGYRIITMAFEYFAKKNLKTKKQRDDYLKQRTFSLSELDQKLVSYIQTLEKDDPIHEQLAQLSDPQQPIKTYLLGSIAHATDKQAERPALDECIADVKGLLSLDELSKNRRAPVKEGEKGGEGFRQIQMIQKMLDAFMAVSHAVKALHLVDGRKPIDMPDDTGFYGEFSSAYEEYTQSCIVLYNKTRNHLTKKPFATDKIKINFDMPTLLNGWDVNKETDNASVLFEKDGLYYLGIMHPRHKKLFDYSKGINDVGNDKKNQARDELFADISTSEGGYRKVVYKLLPGANKMLPKVFFSKSRIDYFSPSDEVQRIRNTASHSKSGNPQKGFAKAEFRRKDCHTIIDFYKASINRHPEWKAFGFHFSPTESYEDLSGFYREVEQQGYSMDFHSIRESYIDECVESGKLFLFQIYNKDFSPYSKGTPNLHTLYWKGLFEPENLKDVVLKLNGEAEIFYRKHSIRRNDSIVHRASEAIENKNEKNPKKTSTFEYDIIKDRRYTQDKFQFHVPVTLNFKAQGVTRFNDKVNKALVKSKGMHIIGIDRGERHLLYYTVINTKGKIIKQGSLNRVSTDQGYSVDYQQKLHAKETERQKARKSWSSIENIKELKAGYLSHVVHKLAKLVEKYNAIACLEDLNFGFKRGRFKVEKQVYQKFEKALIDKLNYLVFKDAKHGHAGHYLKAYQLTAPFESFEKLGKQSGILYYVQAAYTSKIDSETGFINFLYTRYQSLSKSKEFFKSFDSINYNPDTNYFEFSFDYENFSVRQSLKGYRTQWTVCTHGDERYFNKPDKQGQWKTKTVNVAEQLKELFNKYGIDHEDGENIKTAIALEKDTVFYKKLYWLLGVTLSLRHSMGDEEARNKGVSDKDKDFILSPVRNKNGVFFDSRNANDSQPKDADANGAYHIALKGLWNLQQIQEHDWEAEKPKKLNLAMKNEDWFSFVTSRLN